MYIVYKLYNGNKVNLNIHPSRKFRHLCHGPSRFMREGWVVHFGEFRHDASIFCIHLDVNAY